MLDDRMEPENIKDVAASLMEQSVPAGVTGGANDVGTGHPDAGFAKGLFGEGKEPLPLQESTQSSEYGGLDLTPLAGVSVEIREDLVQQAAQSLVKNQTDAYLAISGRMSADEIAKALQVARTWRRPDDDWQETFRTAPQTGFSFIDRKKPNKKNKAESFIRGCVSYMRNNSVQVEEAPAVVRRIAKSRGVRLSESQLAKVGQIVADLV